MSTDIARKRHLLFGKKLIKVWFWLLFMSSTFLYKAYQQIDSHMVKSNVMVSTKTNSQSWNKYRIRFIVKITIPYIWRFLFNILGGAVASWPLVRSSPVRALAGDIVFCSWARHLTLTVPLSARVYKWVPANLMLGGNPAMDWHPIHGGVEILLVASCHGNQS